ncbi:MAG TPA: PilT/PilU family type 4a pilus ATPase [Kofleriaceae bacterium]|nr:PilT/PilU family type 4a pilus ATPase [Kofleriaceae bacterium]
MTRMPAIDSLLKVMILRDAEAMTVAAGVAPTLRRAGNPEPLALPPMNAAMVETFISEIATEPARHALATRGSAEVAYRTADGASFSIVIEPSKLLIRRSTTAPAAPAPKPVPVPPVRPERRPEGPESKDPSRITAAITEAIDRRASDVLASSGQPLRLRIDGDVTPLHSDPDPISDSDLLALLDEPRRAALAETGSVDLATTIASARIRINVFRHHTGLGAALRLIHAQPPSLRDLGLPDDLTTAASYRSGLVLVCGQAGSGKSTTLVALVDHVNRTRAAHVITLEDPIEYEHAPRRSLVHQREIGLHAASFADGLRAALRESPDVIVVGELRDKETIAIALTAAETGHLVLATMHAPNAAGAVDRVIDVFPDAQQRQIRTQLAGSRRVILTQHLLPRTSAGRVPAIERVVVTPAIATLIRKGELQMFGAHVQSGRDAGMIPLEKSLAELVKSRAVDAATARAVAQDLELFETSLRAR